MRFPSVDLKDIVRAVDTINPAGDAETSIEGQSERNSTTPPSRPETAVSHGQGHSEKSIKPQQPTKSMTTSPIPVTAKPTPAAEGSTPASPPAKPGPSTWAKVAAAPVPGGALPIRGPPPSAHQDPIPEMNAPFKLEPGIPRNRAGQRIDPPTCAFNKEESDRIRRLNLCNVQFLMGDCPYGKNCCHLHDYDLKPTELEMLKLVARMCPCVNGPDCIEVNCIYGHRCIAPRAPEKKGGRNCIFGKKCRFTPQQHFSDTKVVKRMLY